MPIISSPLRYPGGKSRLTGYVSQILAKNNLTDCTYIEPFAGGAGIACSLLIKGIVSSIIINDINTLVYSFWRSVIDHSEELCELVYNADVNMQEWYKQKAIQSDMANHSIIELGYAALFLNRVNRSGILNGGVIGGKAQSGKYKMDARFGKDNLINRINRIAEFRDRIRVYNQDVFDFIDTTVPGVCNAFIYLDPPYFKQGSSLYENNFQMQDHNRLAESVKNNLQIPWIVSYDNVDEICELYAECNSRKIDISYTAQRKYIGSEVIFYSPILVIPPI